MTQSQSRARKEMCEPLESRVLLSAAPIIIGYLPDYEFGNFSSVDLGRAIADQLFLHFRERQRCTFDISE